MGVQEKKKGLGVYVHIPWCLSKCPYCDFSSTAIPPEKIPEDRYVRAIAAELRSILEAEPLGEDTRRLESLYIGGGTPTVLGPDALRRVISSVVGLFTQRETPEVTIEANPETIDSDKLRSLRDAGANRISIGVQSVHDRHLATLGRPHDAVKALGAVELADRAGFEKIGVDLIFGVPGQTLGDWKVALGEIAGLRPGHVSLYGLTIEEGTPFYTLYVKAGSPSPAGPSLPSEDDQARMYTHAVETLTEAGYIHYEISNFALPGHESVHNTGYWVGRDYLGLGAGAHSYLSFPGHGRRWWNVKDAERYMDSVEENGIARAATEVLTKDEAMSEAVMLALRMCRAGIDSADFRDRFGATPEKVLGEGLKKLMEEGLLTARSGKGEGYLLTRRGILLSDEVITTLLGRASAFT